MTDFLTSKAGRKLAYNHSPGREPTVVFLGGFRSDMQGTKAVFLEDWAKARGQAFLRLDYSGHGESGGEFLDGSIGDWAEDAQAVIDARIGDGSVVLVGSSMGGWISTILSAKLTQNIVGIVGIAAAPDFTEDSMWGGFSDEQRAALMETGRVELPSDYSDEPYVITKRLIEEGRKSLVLRSPLPMDYPVRLLQGTADEDVEMSVALRLLDHIDGDDVRLTLVKGADHRFSTPDCLAMIARAVEEILKKVGS